MRSIGTSGYSEVLRSIGRCARFVTYPLHYMDAGSAQLTHEGQRARDKFADHASGDQASASDLTQKSKMGQGRTNETDGGRLQHSWRTSLRTSLRAHSRTPPRTLPTGKNNPHYIQVVTPKYVAKAITKALAKITKNAAKCIAKYTAKCVALKDIGKIIAKDIARYGRVLR